MVPCNVPLPVAFQEFDIVAPRIDMNDRSMVARNDVPIYHQPSKSSRHRWRSGIENIVGGRLKCSVVIAQQDTDVRGGRVGDD